MEGSFGFSAMGLQMMGGLKKLIWSCSGPLLFLLLLSLLSSSLGGTSQDPFIAMYPSFLYFLV